MKSKRVKMMAERLFLLDPNTHDGCCDIGRGM